MSKLSAQETYHLRTQIKQNFEENEIKIYPAKSKVVDVKKASILLHHNLRRPYKR